MAVVLRHVTRDRKSVALFREREPKAAASIRKFLDLRLVDLELLEGLVRRAGAAEGVWGLLSNLSKNRYCDGVAA